MPRQSLPIPSFFDSQLVGKSWRVNYAQRASDAMDWAKNYSLRPVGTDRTKIALVGIDVMDTFCNPEGELFVGGRSGRGAVDDNIRACTFMYENMDVISHLYFTLDTHWAMQIFHPSFWVDQSGKHPDPFTNITHDEVVSGKWRVNPAIASEVANGNFALLQRHAFHYTKCLSDGGKYDLTIWPYHAILGGIGHTLDASVHEAAFFYSIARSSQIGFEIKGGHPWTENYSVLRPEVSTGPDNLPLGSLNTNLIKKLLDHDAVIFYGQAKSHCFAWTIDDLLRELVSQDAALVSKIYLLEDATSAVTVPDGNGKFIVDYTDEANQAFDRFRSAGMHVVRTTDPIESWPNIRL